MAESSLASLKNALPVSSAASQSTSVSALRSGQRDYAAIEQRTADELRLVLDRGLPDLPFVHPRKWWREEDAALQRNREIVRESTIEDWLPSVVGAVPDRIGLP